MDLNIKNFIVSSNGLTKKILYYFLPYALAGIEDIEFDDEKLISNIASELKITKFRAKIELEFPIGNIIEQGSSSTEIKDMKNIVFKRD